MDGVKVGHSSLGAGERPFGIDGPVDVAHGLEELIKRDRIGESLMASEKVQISGVVGVDELLKQAPPEQS